MFRMPPLSGTRSADGAIGTTLKRHPFCLRCSRRTVDYWDGASLVLTPRNGWPSDVAVP